MDVRLQNAYVQVLLDNFMEVVKQNLLFQAQLEVNKSNVAEAEEIKRKIQELADRNIELQKQLDSVGNIDQMAANLNDAISKNSHLQKTLEEKENLLSTLATELSSVKSSLNQKESQLSSQTNISQEKDRLQSAVNDYMRQLKQAKDELLKVKSESQDVLIQNNNRIEELTKYVTRLEAVVPANKLKKVKLGEVIQPDTPDQTESQLPIDDNVKAGGTF